MTVIKANRAQKATIMVEREHPRPVEDGEHKFTFRKVQLLKNETLGTGSYGAVCKAKCDQLICAAKLLHPVLLQMQATKQDKEYRQPFHRFEEECRFLSRIYHPNIVQYLGMYHDPETNAPVLLMELMDESLTHFLESSPGDIPYHIQVNLSHDIAQALAFLHANGIIHRDLSSNNVLLIAGSRAKVTDFGMSKFIDLNATRLATMTQCPGTPVFMSPEALDEPPVYTEQLDNFSFGVLLVQMATKKFPRPGNRFETVEIPSPRNPACTVRSRVLIPEVERRQAHISLIDSTHPLLPTALECLKDEAVERPSSQQLCQSLDTLKGTVKYKESLQKDMVQILHKQLEEKNLQIRAKDYNLQILHQEKEEQIREKDLQMQAKEHQLRRLNQQLETNEEITANLHHLVAQRDVEIAELRELKAGMDCKELSSLRDKEDHKAQTTPVIKEKLGISWETLSSSPKQLGCVSAVVGDKAYFRSACFFKKYFANYAPVGPLTLESGVSVWEFTLSSREWKQLPDHQLCDFSLVSIDNQLTTVGGLEKRLGCWKESNKLYKFVKGKWKERSPPMPTKRWGCSVVYECPNLIVAASNFGSEHELVPPPTLAQAQLRAPSTVGLPQYNMPTSAALQAGNILTQLHPSVENVLAQTLSPTRNSPIPTRTPHYLPGNVPISPAAPQRQHCTAGLPNSPIRTRTPHCLPSNVPISTPGLPPSPKVFGNSVSATTVEILNTHTNRWSKVRSLPFPVKQPSSSICGENIYIHSTKESNSVLYCSMSSLTQKTDNWKTIAPLPVERSTLVAVKGQLLAVGGVSANGNSTNEVFHYDPGTNSWQLISQMRTARFNCAVALLLDNRLIVVGGARDTPQIELATVKSV